MRVGNSSCSRCEFETDPALSFEDQDASMMKHLEEKHPNWMTEPLVRYIRPIELEAIREVRKHLPNAPDDEWVMKHCPTEIGFARRMIAAERALEEVELDCQLGGYPVGKKCTYNAKDVHEIRGGFHQLGDKDFNDPHAEFICDVHYYQMLEKKLNAAYDLIREKLNIQLTPNVEPCDAPSWWNRADELTRWKKP